MDIFKNDQSRDDLSHSMQNEVIKIASERLGYALPQDLISKIRLEKWSYMGLEMMIDTVRTIDVVEIKKYLSQLD